MRSSIYCTIYVTYNKKYDAATIAANFIKNIQTLQNLWDYQLYVAYGVICLNVVYFFYAQYEGKLHVACDSCQLGNIVVTTVISLVKLAVIITASYFLLYVT